MSSPTSRPQSYSTVRSSAASTVLDIPNFDFRDFDLDIGPISELLSSSSSPAQQARSRGESELKEEDEDEQSTGKEELSKDTDGKKSVKPMKSFESTTSLVDPWLMKPHSTPSPVPPVPPPPPQSQITQAKWSNAWSSPNSPSVTSQFSSPVSPDHFPLDSPIGGSVRDGHTIATSKSAWSLNAGSADLTHRGENTGTGDHEHEELAEKVRNYKSNSSYPTPPPAPPPPPIRIAPNSRPVSSSFPSPHSPSSPSASTSPQQSHPSSSLTPSRSEMFASSPIPPSTPATPTARTAATQSNSNVNSSSKSTISLLPPSSLSNLPIPPSPSTRDRLDSKSSIKSSTSNNSVKGSIRSSNFPVPPPLTPITPNPRFAKSSDEVSGYSMARPESRGSGAGSERSQFIEWSSGEGTFGIRERETTAAKKRSMGADSASGKSRKSGGSKWSYAAGSNRTSEQGIDLEGEQSRAIELGEDDWPHSATIESGESGLGTVETGYGKEVVFERATKASITTRPSSTVMLLSPTLDQNQTPLKPLSPNLPDLTFGLSSQSQSDVPVITRLKQPPPALMIPPVKKFDYEISGGGRKGDDSDSLRTEISERSAKGRKRDMERERKVSGKSRLSNISGGGSTSVMEDDGEEEAWRELRRQHGGEIGEEDDEGEENDRWVDELSGAIAEGQSRQGIVPGAIGAGGTSQFNNMGWGMGSVERLGKGAGNRFRGSYSGPSTPDTSGSSLKEGDRFLSAAFLRGEGGKVTSPMYSSPLSMGSKLGDDYFGAGAVGGSGSGSSSSRIAAQNQPQRTINHPLFTEQFSNTNSSSSSQSLPFEKPKHSSIPVSVSHSSIDSPLAVPSPAFAGGGGVTWMGWDSPGLTNGKGSQLKELDQSGSNGMKGKGKEIHSRTSSVSLQLTELVRRADAVRGGLEDDGEDDLKTRGAGLGVGLVHGNSIKRSKSDANSLNSWKGKIERWSNSVSPFSRSSTKGHPPPPLIIEKPTPSPAPWETFNEEPKPVEIEDPFEERETEDDIRRRKWERKKRKERKKRMSRRKRWMVIIGVVLLMVGIVIACVVGYQQIKDNQEIANLSADQKCVCADGSTTSGCNLLAQGVLSSVKTANSLFFTQIDPDRLSYVFSHYFLAPPVKSVDCSAQADLIALSSLSKYPGRLTWSQAAVTWDLAMEESTSGGLKNFVNGLNFTGLGDLITTSGKKKVKRNDADTAFQIKAGGYLFDFKDQTVTVPSISWISDQSPTSSESSTVDSSSTALTVLNNATSWAAATSTQRSTALSHYWADTLGFSSNQLTSFLNTVTNASIMIPFNAEFNFDLSGGNITSGDSFPLAIGCWPGSDLSDTQIKEINSVEVTAFGLPTVNSTDQLDRVCSDRPLYGLVNLLNLNLPFVEEDPRNSTLPKQAFILQDSAKSRLTFHAGELLSGGGSPPFDNTSPSNSLAYFGTSSHLSHIILEYLQNMPSTESAQDLVNYVLASSTSSPSPNSTFFSETQGLAKIPILEVQLWGGLKGTSDINYGISSITNSNSTNFFGSVIGNELRNFESTIYWSQTSISDEIAIENSSSESSFDKVWNSITTGETSNDIWQALDQAGLVTKA